MNYEVLTVAIGNIKRETCSKSRESLESHSFCDKHRQATRKRNCERSRLEGPSKAGFEERLGASLAGPQCWLAVHALCG